MAEIEIDLTEEEEKQVAALAEEWDCTMEQAIVCILEWAVKYDEAKDGK